MKGQIVKINGGFYYVKSSKEVFTLRASGKLRLEKKSPVVGDFVEFRPDGLIEKIHERKNFLERPKVANIDQIAIVTSLVEPNYSSLLLNKLLSIFEYNEIIPVIIFTKIDKAKKSYLEIYKKQGYLSFEISNKTKQGIPELKNIFKNKVTAFTGQTGSGKTSTINSLTNWNFKVQKISKALGRGKHTTRIVEMYEWNNGKIIDTPGFSSVTLNLDLNQLSKSFHDFKQLSKNCKFRTCYHDKEIEEHCAIKTAVKKGYISNERYLDYLELRREIKNGN